MHERIALNGRSRARTTTYHSRSSARLRYLMALGALVAVLLTLFAGRAQAISFTQLVAFGDSLSDTGNVSANTGGLLPLPPYTPGRFTNGPVWIETFASNLGLSAVASNTGGTNYAHGGAVTGAPLSSSFPSLSLTDQMSQYLTDTGGFADPNALYVIWGGGNDVRDGDVTGSAANIAAMVTNLAGAGASNFLVANLPDVGLTPEAQGFGPVAAAGATFLSTTHNANLAAEMATLRGSLGVSIFELDVFGFLNDVIANNSFGITNTTDACYDGVTGTGGAGTVCSDPDSHLFWDGIHPTAAAHAALGNFASTVVPVPAAVWLFGSALGLLGWVRRKAA